MNSKKVLIGTIAVLAVVGAWAAFRPELLFVNKTVNESFPATTAQSASAKSDAPTELAKGTFRSLAHDTKGAAALYKLPDGRRTLRLTEFATSNGPDVHVYLVGAKDAPDNATVQNAGFVDLGSIKGNVGDQNYDVPADTDLNKYQAVTIWCARFHVNFGTAPLMPGSTAPLKKQGS